MKWIYPFIGLIVFEYVANIFAKEWSLKQSYWFFFLSITGYIICNLFWLFSIQKGAGLARGTILFTLSSLILSTMTAVLYYKEVLTLKQGFGLLLGFISILLML